MGFSVAGMLGGAIAVWLLSLIVEKFLFKNDEPTTRAFKTVAVVLIIASVIAGFGAANGGPFVWTAGFTYVPGAIGIFLWYRSRYASKWTDEA